MTDDSSSLQPILPLPVAARPALPTSALPSPASLPLQVDHFRKTLPSGRSFSGDMARVVVQAPEMALPAVVHLQQGISHDLHSFFFNPTANTIIVSEVG